MLHYDIVPMHVTLPHGTPAYNTIAWYVHPCMSHYDTMVWYVPMHVTHYDMVPMHVTL